LGSIDRRNRLPLVSFNENFGTPFYHCAAAGSLVRLCAYITERIYIMGEAKRRKLAGTYPAQSPTRTVPEDLRADVAAAVNSVVLLDPGKCWTRAILGERALLSLKIPAKIAIGSLIFRAGPDDGRDVVYFSGPNNRGYVQGAGGSIDEYIAEHRDIFLNPNVDFLGHAWIKSGGDLIDFSAGDWQPTWDCVATFDGRGAVEWQATPPEFYWQDWTSLTAQWRCDGLPAIGEAWYCEGIAVPPDADRREVARRIDLMNEQAFEEARKFGLIQHVLENLQALRTARAALTSSAAVSTSDRGVGLTERGVGLAG